MNTSAINLFPKIHQKHVTLKNQKYYEKFTTEEDFANEAKGLLEEIRSAGSFITDISQRQRLESYALYWGRLISELTYEYPDISLLEPEESLSNIYVKSSDRERTKLNPPSNIINRGNPYFVGRDALLEQLHQELQQTDRLAICAITGMGGVGKTELALQYALRYQDNYPGGLCWFSVRGLNFGTQVLSFGRTELGLTIPDELEFNEQVRYCWRNWPEGTALIVLDDVPSFSNDYKERIKPYLPPAQSRFKVLITSRQRPGVSYQRIDLDVLSPEAALTLLCTLVGKERIDNELNEAEVLCDWLGYLPLGLELVGRYLDLDQSLTIAKVQKRLEKKKLAAQELLYPEEQGEMTAQLGIPAAFELSWEDLPPEAQQLGCRLSLFGSAPFEWFLVENCLIETDDNEEWEEEQEELEELRDRFLVNGNLLQLTEQQTYRLHQLIREFFQTKLAQLPEADGYKQRFCQAMVGKAKEIPDRPTRDQIAAVKPAIPHLAEAATVLTDWLRDEDLIGLFMGLGGFYKGQGTYDQSEPWYKQCLDITRSRLGKEHPDVGDSLNNLALLYLEQGRYDEAEPLLVQALDIAKKLPGEDHPDVAASLNNLAVLYSDQGRYDEAETLFVHSLELTKQGFGQNHPSMASSLNNLAKLYLDQGRYDQAEPLFIKALGIIKKRLGDEHPDVATTISGLAGLYKAQGRYDEAETLFLKAFDIRKKLLGHNHPHLAQSLNNLGFFYSSKGRYDQAEPLLIQALNMKKKLLGENHPHVANSLNNLAFLYYDQGSYHEAEPLFVQALNMTKKLLGEDHPYVATSKSSLALLYLAQGRYHEAEPLFVEALELIKQRLGKDNPYLAFSTLNNLAELYKAQGRYHKAELLYVEALEIAERKLGSNHPDTVTIRNNLEILRNIPNNPDLLRDVGHKVKILEDFSLKPSSDQSSMLISYQNKSYFTGSD